MNRLLTLKVEHPYYGKYFFKSFHWKLDDYSAQCLERYQLVLRSDISGESEISLYYYGKNSIVAVVSKIASFLSENSIFIDVFGPSKSFLMATDKSLKSRNTLVFSNVNSNLKDVSENKTQGGIKILTVQELPNVRDDIICRIILNSDALQRDLIAGVDGYSLKMTSRMLPRSYYIKNWENNQKRTLKIKSRNHISFIFDEMPKVINGEEYVVFKSGSMALPLKLEEGDFLSLIEEENIDGELECIRENVLIKNLPAPSEDDLSVINIDGKVQMCFDIFVYL
jgi:hypothetical protein